MNYEMFQLTLAEEVRRLIGKQDKVQIQQVQKNNGIVFQAMSILTNGEKISPVLYLEGFYQRYQQGVPIAHLAKLVLAQYRENKKNQNLDFTFFKHYEKVKDNIFCKIINSEKNRALLQSVPCRKILDLAIVCYYQVDQALMKGAVIQINDQHIAVWEISEQELLNTAIANTVRENPLEIQSMTEMLDEMLSLKEKDELGDFEEICASPMPMYIITNQRRMNGAICAFLPEYLEKAARVMQGDFYILPSSIHECILVPAFAAFSPKELGEMVKDINDTQIEPQEVLSNHIYCYHTVSKTVTREA
ncbi:MAG: DUF5688 family protein [Lachnospiraceae bacterium]|nr:DUF5688 family protein [Lachnospiraceae bacterium]